MATKNLKVQEKGFYVVSFSVLQFKCTGRTIGAKIKEFGDTLQKVF